jgi:hypothetical protein
MANITPTLTFPLQGGGKFFIWFNKFTLSPYFPISSFRGWGGGRN